MSEEPDDLVAQIRAMPHDGSPGQQLQLLELELLARILSEVHSLYLLIDQIDRGRNEL